ncbi:MAG: HAD hydrolase-like protein, partial [Pseudaminobacter sp.]|nr:HAD hydrolase-like protein [Pseudaminobacter sp.]
MGQPIIVFDLDGTLVDTAPDLLDSLNHCLGAGGVAHTDTNGFHQFVGHGGRVMIERAYAAQQKALATDEHDRLFALFLDHYGTNI